MAQKSDQGTGKHPHKSTEEPYPHHEGKTTQGDREQRGSGSSTTKEQTRSTREHDRGSESSDLKEREYRDAQGNVHHHTHGHEEQHGKK
jgi:hypothetical protein